jgi:hypothetical protein
MSNISTEIDVILEQDRGEDVRDAFTDACEKIASELLPDAETEGYFATVNSSGEWEAMPWT